METLGTEYGGWDIPINAGFNENSIIYSGGVGEDMSFDLKLQNKYNCNIILIDPTQRAIKHYEEVNPGLYLQSLPYALALLLWRHAE